MRAGLLLAAAAFAATLLPSPSARAIELFGLRCCAQMSSGSMMPTLLVGDLFALLRVRADSPPKAGELVAFEMPKDNTLYVKRVVGLPGERIQMIEGALHIDGVPVKRERIADFVDTEDGKTVSAKRWRETLPNGVSYETLDLVDNGFLDNTKVFDVPAGHYFLLGDNRDNSNDSRMFGAIPAAKVQGRLVRVLPHLTRFLRSVIAKLWP